MAKEFLSRNNIYFVEKDINVDAQARGELQRRNISGVPTFLVGNDIIVGFDQQKLLQLVDHRLTACLQCGQKMRVPVNKGKIMVKCSKCSHQFSITT